MAKDTFYFSHDYNSRNDIKIKKLIAKHGYLGFGIFWAIIEDLYNNTNVLPTDYDCIAYELRSDENTIKSIVNDFELFVIEDGFFGSHSVERRLSERNAKSVKARESVLKRWNKPPTDTNVLPTNYDSNTIKESIVKEIKEIKVKDNIESINDRKLKFAHSLKPFLNDYPKEMIRAFCDYWTEHGEKDKKFRAEKEKSFAIERRLKTWKENESKFNKNRSSTNQGYKPASVDREKLIRELTEDAQNGNIPGEY
jgi:hypothetical protein